MKEIDEWKMNQILMELKKTNEWQSTHQICRAIKKHKPFKRTIHKCIKLPKPKPAKKRNPRKVGQQYVNEAMAEYQKNDFVVWKPGSKAIWLPHLRKMVSQSQDILEVADFIAIKPDDKVHFVQVTSATEGAETSLAKKRRDKMDGIPFNLEHSTLVVMARRKGGGWRIWRRDASGWSEVRLYPAAP